MEKHVNNVCRAASFALHKLGQIRKYLDKHTTEKTSSRICYLPSW